jgi:sugar phosphate permease
MAYRNVTIAVPTSVTQGAAAIVKGLEGKYIWLRGTFSATVAFQGSWDGTTWTTFQTGLTAGAFVAVPQPFTHVRADTTAYTSGTPVADCRGRS